ncbi:discoidin domain-containing protein [Chitinophaga lutea]
MNLNYLLRSKTISLLFILLCAALSAQAQSNAVANGPGSTYELLEAAGYNVESPDCGHAVRHIAEVMDNTLGKYVFAFTLHRDLDDDRCGATDRQRIELRGNGSHQQGTQGSTTHWRWKFKLDANFQESPNFTHIMQLKAYGNGHGSGSPILHLTPRYDNKMELGHPGSGGVKATADLNLFRGVWVEAYVKIKHDDAGTLQVVIKRLSDGVTLLSYSSNNIDMWEDGAGYGAPKFGFYRSLTSPSYLRDETIYLADICVAKSATDLCPTDVNNNVAPTVSLTAPAPNATFTAPASITVSANAADSDGTVSKVEFFQGSIKIGEDASSPYSITWTNVAAGNYALTAKATDDDNATTTSAAVNITVNAAPSCVPASASTDDGNVPANVLDNDLNTRWSASGDPQWIQFCLNTVQTVTGVDIAFYNGDTRTSTFDILLSQNGTTWTTAASGLVSSGTTVNAETFNITPATAKYVRIVGHGNSVNAWNSYTEVDILTGSGLQAIAAKMTEPVIDGPELNNYPNPFQHHTQISFVLRKAGQTRLSVVDMQGRTISVIVNGVLQAGKHTVPLNNNGMQAGTYILLLQQHGKSVTRKVQKL